MKTCPTCGQKFDPMWRIAVDAELDKKQLAGVLAQIIYCSPKCKKKVQNRRHYLRRKRSR